MKRIFLILFAVLLTGGMMLQAGPVSADRALEVAKKALPQPATKASGDLKLIWNGENAATKAAGQPAFYVFGRDAGGFVIIAGDDNVQPVLAISETNRFEVEGMPDNLQWWMDNIKNYVRTTAVQTPEARVQWAKFAETKAPTVEPDDPGLSGKVGHKTPEWNQGNSDNHYFERQVFNTHCPKDAEDKLTLTGCVATALGELLTTMSGLYPTAIVPYPTQPKAPGYEVSAGSVAAAGPGEEYTFSFLGPSSSIPWEQLRTLTGTAAIQQAIDDEKTALLDDLAKLLADLGAMTQAEYGSDGTGASSEYATTMMAKYMGFNKAASFEYAEDYSLRQWKELLKAQLSRHPVFFSGRRTNSGHAFLLDGYAIYDGADEMFYVNFGWSGSNNGYYIVNQFGDYNQSCAAAIDFYPKSESSYIYSLQYDDSYLPGLSFEDPFSESDWFIITYGVANVGTTDYSGKMQVKLLNKDDVWKADFAIYTDGGWSDEFELPLGHRGYDYLLIKLTGSPTIEFGDKIVIYCTTDAGQSVFAPIKERNDGTVLNSLPIVPAAFIKAKASYNAGEYFPLELKNYDYLFAGTVWTITKEGGSPVVLDQAEREYQFTEAGTYKIEAAVKESASGAVVETITTYVTVN